MQVALELQKLLPLATAQLTGNGDKNINNSIKHTADVWACGLFGG
jgi:hypothetical protein